MGKIEIIYQDDARKVPFIYIGELLGHDSEFAYLRVNTGELKLKLKGILKVNHRLDSTSANKFRKEFSKYLGKQVRIKAERKTPINDEIIFGKLESIDANKLIINADEKLINCEDDLICIHGNRKTLIDLNQVISIRLRRQIDKYIGCSMRIRRFPYLTIGECPCGSPEYDNRPYICFTCGLICLKNWSTLDVEKDFLELMQCILHESLHFVLNGIDPDDSASIMLDNISIEKDIIPNEEIGNEL